MGRKKELWYARYCPNGVCCWNACSALLMMVSDSQRSWLADGVWGRRGLMTAFVIGVLLMCVGLVSLGVWVRFLWRMGGKVKVHLCREWRESGLVRSGVSIR